MISVRYGEPKKLSCEQSIFVSFPYKAVIVDVIRGFPERVYNPKDKSWEMPFDVLSKLQEKLRLESFDVVGEPVNNKKFGEKVIVKHTLAKELKTKPYPYQKEGIDELLSFDKYLLLYDMGMGKGLTTIAVALKRKELGQIKHCLVISGINGMKYTWKNEVEQHTTSSVKVIGSRKNKKGTWVSGSTKDKLDDLNSFNEFFLVTNVESLRNKEIRDKLKDLMKKNVIEMIIFDELQSVKSSSSQQGKALLLLSKYVKYFYGLTGTPLMNSPLDLYVPLKLVDKEKSNLYGFSHRYANYGGFGGYEIVSYKNLSELQQKLDSVSLRKKKSDVLNLPPKIYIDEYVELGKKQRKIYDDVLKMIMENIDEISLSPDPLGQMIRLRQATADTSILSSTIHESAKIDRLKEIVKEIVDNGDSCLIFSSWTTVTDILERELQEYKMAVITGKVKDRERQKKKFMEDDSCHVLIGTVAAMGTGLTLTKATTVIFMDEPYTRAAKEQAEDRAHRIGTTSSINIITLMAKDTIDEYIHKLVMKKGVMSDSIVDAKYDVRSKDVIRYMLTGEGNIEKGNVNDTGK